MTLPIGQFQRKPRLLKRKTPDGILARATAVIWFFCLFFGVLSGMMGFLTHNPIYTKILVFCAIGFFSPVAFLFGFGIIHYIIHGDPEG